MKLEKTNSQRHLEEAKGENLKTIAGMDKDGRDTVKALYKGDNNSDSEDDGDKKPAAKPKVLFSDVDVGDEKTNQEEDNNNNNNEEEVIGLGELLGCVESWVV